MESPYKNTISSYSQHPLCSVILSTYVINSSFLNTDFHGQLEWPQENGVMWSSKQGGLWTLWHALLIMSTNDALAFLMNVVLLCFISPINFVANIPLRMVISIDNFSGFDLFLFTILLNFCMVSNMTFNKCNGKYTFFILKKQRKGLGEWPHGLQC